VVLRAPVVKLVESRPRHLSAFARHGFRGFSPQEEKQHKPTEPF